MPSKFDLLRQQREASGSPQAPVSKFDLLRQQREDPDSPGRALARGTKSAVAGALGSIPDTLVTMPYNAVTGGINAALGTEIQPLPSTTETIDQGIDALTGGYTKTPDHARTAQEGVKAAAGMLSPGGLARTAAKMGAKGVEKGLNFIGSTRFASVAAAGASGAAMEDSRQRGDSAPVSFGKGLGTSLAVEGLTAGLNPKALARGATKVAGFGKGNLKPEAVEAARSIGAQLPNVAATEGALPHYAYNLINKTPVFGDKLRKNTQQATESYQKAWEKVFDDVGPLKTDDVKEALSQSYKLLKETLPPQDTLSPYPLWQKMGQIEQDLKSSFHAAPTKALFKTMQDIKAGMDLPEGFEKLGSQAQHQIMDQSRLPVRDVLQLKRELHKFMRDKNIFDGSDPHTLSYVKSLASETQSLLEHYGHSNPAFLKALKEADGLYAKAAKRETLENLLGSHLKNPQTDRVSWTPLSKVLSDRQNQKKLLHALGEEHYAKLKDFTTYAQAMNASAASNPNPSGTSLVTAAWGLIQGLAGTNPLPSVLGIGGVALGSKLLTSETFLDSALKFAKESTERSAEDILKIISAQTGVSARELTKPEKKDRQKQARFSQNIPPKLGYPPKQ